MATCPSSNIFCRSYRGEEVPLVSGVDGYKALELIIASHMAIANASAIKLPLDPERADLEFARVRSR